MNAIVTDLAGHVGVQKACAALAYPRSRYYRPPGTATSGAADRQPPTSPRALSAAERETVRATLNSDRFVDSSPREVYGTLLDEGVFLCSISTLYRILRANVVQPAAKFVRPASRQHPHRVEPTRNKRL